MFHNVLKITHTPNFRFKSNHLIKFSLDIYLTYEKKTQQESSKFVSNVFALALLDFTNDKKYMYTHVPKVCNFFHDDSR